MALADNEIHKLMQDIGSINAKLQIILDNHAAIKRRILEPEKKINRHTTILGLAGTIIMFFENKIMGLLS